MKTVGVYVFTDMVKKRITKKRESYFDGQNYIGLRHILSEIDRNRFSVRYVSKDTINSVDFVLISITSYYDMLNTLNELYEREITATVIVGGAGYSNCELLSTIADIGVVGRGEGLINDLLSGERIPGVWYRDDGFRKTVDIRPLSEYIEIDDATMGKYCESSIGCSGKCYFCEYSWKNKHMSKSDTYTSGLVDRETRWGEVDWTKYKNKDLVTAIDGIDEKTRRIINKPISATQIKSKIMEIYDQPRNYLSLKLYCLLGYPFEAGFSPEETLDAIASCAGHGDNRLNILVVSPHFMPMPFTPMECEPLNWINFRNKIKQYDFTPYQQSNVKVYWNWSLASSPISAAEATVAHRAGIADTPTVHKILCSSKYRGLTARQKEAVLKKFFGHILGAVKEVCPYIERQYPTEAAKAEYKRRLGGGANA